MIKKILNYCIAVITIIYIGFLCYYNIAKGGFSFSGDVLVNIAIYGGCVIAIVSAILNIIGMPFQSIFLIILTLFIVIFILTMIIPDWFAGLFGMNTTTGAIMGI